MHTDSNHPVLDSTLGMRLLAASPDCVKLIDLEGNIRFANENGLCLLEIDDYAHLHGRCWQQLWPETSRSEICHAIAEAKAGRIGRFSGFCPTAKGTHKWWDVAVSPVCAANGDLAWLLAVSRDITAHKTIENELRRSEERFRALADNIAQFAWMADASGHIYWYNQRWFDFTGTTLDEMKGWGWKAVHHPDHIERVVQKFTACLESESIWEDTFPLRATDGSYRWFLSRAMPIRGANGNIKLWCGTNTDITEQRNASLRLRQLARLVELSHEAIIVRSPSQEILLWNRGCEVLYGYSKSEALGKNSKELLRTLNAIPPAELENLLASEGTWSGEMRRTAKDGSLVWVEGRKQAIRMGDEFVVLETDRDITERRKSDEIRNLLVGELNHRVKNTLAIVQSLASQTARSSDNIDDFVLNFNGRLQSLSGAHNVLTDENWSGARILPLINAQLNIIAGRSNQTRISGPDVFIPPQAALQMTLILHELATNAVKHGALSQHGGTVDISWSVIEGAPRMLNLAWRESGGPPVAPPTRRGFGLSLIERTGRLPHITAAMSFDPCGIICEISTKLDEQLTTGSAYFDPAKTTVTSEAR